MGETIPVKGNYLTYTLREPMGVVAAIVPWNFPLLLAAWKVAPALACGNTVILKPASQTPLTALALGEIALEIGLPPGVLNVLTGPGPSSVRQSSSIPASTRLRLPATPATGKGIMRGAADTLKRITLELGGKSPNIVLADADIDAACAARRPASSTARVRSARRDRGCSSTADQGEFVDKLAARAKKMVPGDPMDPKTRFGALSSREQMDTVLRYIDSRQAGRRHAGGRRAAPTSAPAKASSSSRPFLPTFTPA